MLSALISSILFFSFFISPPPKKYIEAEVVSVYDGDTFFVNIKGWPDIVGKRMSIRILGIDAPEIKSKDPEIKYNAEQAQCILYGLIGEKTVRLYNVKKDKYFRLDADVFIDGKNIKPELKKSGLYHDYDGGKKKEF